VATTLKVYANDDDALLFWRVPAAIAACRGFAIERRKTDPSGTVTEMFVPNRVGFAGDPPPAPGQDVSRCGCPKLCTQHLTCCYVDIRSQA
jgi:hypothetical protein